MRTKNPIGTLVCICVVAACGDAPTGIEPFEPQFSHDPVVGGPHTYDFDDLSGSCPGGAESSVLLPSYQGDLEFVDEFGGVTAFGSCAAASLGAPAPFAGKALFVGGSSGAFSISLTDPASAVSVQAFAILGSATMVAHDIDGECGTGVTVTPGGSVVPLTVSCTTPITKIEFVLMPLFVALDKLTVDYLPQDLGGVTAAADLMSVGKSLKHNKGKFEVVATCQDGDDDPVPTTGTLRIGTDEPPVEHTVAHGDRLDLRIKSGKAGRSGKGKSNKSGKSKKKFAGDSFTLTVSCDGAEDATASADFPDKPNSEKSKKSKKSKSKNK